MKTVGGTGFPACAFAPASGASKDVGRVLRAD